ncbi:MAG: aldo/keto reductase [Mycoplasma sp.]|nr:aldo/keto reductase [Mycoplasma sp.]
MKKEFKFKNGDKMPSISLGTWRLLPSEISKSVNAALEANYEGIDTAQIYKNEAHIGVEIATNNDIFITSKLDLRFFESDELAQKAIDESNIRLGRKPIDLFLLHWPGTIEKFVNAYEFLINAKKMGKVKHIGVSNANIKILKMIHEKYGEWPEVNQFKYNVLDQRKDLVDFCHEKEIIVTGYQTIAVLFEHHALSEKQVSFIDELAKKYNKTEAQILLRESLQKNITILPKSKNASRVKENIEVQDFNLTKEEMNEFLSWDTQITTEENIIERYNTLGKSWEEKEHEKYGIHEEAIAYEINSENEGR